MKSKSITRWFMLVAVIALLANVAMWTVKLAWFPGQPFNSEVWRKESPRSIVRQRMADRLLARRSLIGLPRTEVVAMFGEPPETGFFREWDMVYLLGDERNFISIDSEWLVLRLGSNGKVVDARLVTD